MNTILAVAGIYLAGWIITFRLDAWHSITRRNMRREEAIRRATFPANLWPIAALAVVALTIHALITAGLPKSRADRDAEIAELEREALGDVMGDRTTTALREARMPETRPGKRLVCANCGVPLVPAAEGFVHMPEGWIRPCDDAVPTRRGTQRHEGDKAALDALRDAGAVVSPDTRLPSGKTVRSVMRRRHLDEHHHRPLERCPECWPMLP